MRKSCQNLIAAQLLPPLSGKSSTWIRHGPPTSQTMVHQPPAWGRQNETLIWRVAFHLTKIYKVLIKLLLSASLFSDIPSFFNILLFLFRDDNNLLFDFCGPENCCHFAFRGASHFTQALVARSYTVFKIPNKNRRGWLVTLRDHRQHELSNPWLISLNARSLPYTTDDFHNTRMILVKELWLNNFIDRELTNIFLFWRWSSEFEKK